MLFPFFLPESTVNCISQAGRERQAKTHFSWSLMDGLRAMPALLVASICYAEGSMSGTKQGHKSSQLPVSPKIHPCPGPDLPQPCLFAAHPTRKMAAVASRTFNYKKSLCFTFMAVRVQRLELACCLETKSFCGHSSLVVIFSGVPGAGGQGWGMLSSSCS